MLTETRYEDLRTLESAGEAIYMTNGIRIKLVPRNHVQTETESNGNRNFLKITLFQILQAVEWKKP